MESIESHGINGITEICIESVESMESWIKEDFGQYITVSML